MKSRFLCITLLSLLLLATAGPATAGRATRFNQFVGLGDSTLDTGYFRYTPTGVPSIDASLVTALAAGAQGGFAGPGIMTSSFLAGRFGLGASPVSAGGSVFANGAAYSAPLRSSANAPYASGSLPGNVATTQQIANYLASTGGFANPHALYVINSGNNDLIYVQNQSADWIRSNPYFLNDLASQLVLSVAALQAAGARTIMVPNTFYTSALMDLGGVVPAANADSYARAIGYGNTKWAYLTAAGVRFIPADLTSLFRFVSTNPMFFGFTPSSVLSANAPSKVPALTTSWNDISPLEMQTYLFIDGKHLTTAGQEIEADYEASLLTGPAQMSLLAEGPVQGGLARAATIQGQIDLSGQHRGENGVNIWASGNGGFLQILNTPSYPDASGLPFSGSAGADYRLPCGLILGAAFTAGFQTQAFTMNSGHYDQTDQAFSLYTAYRAGPVWGNAVASYALYQDRIIRPVPLGLFTDHNSADTEGRGLSLALRLGADIPLGPLTTGPVAGLVLQQIHMNGFTESGTSGVSALSFGGQTRNSRVTQLGWRVLTDLGRFRPFAEAAWNHEWDSGQRKIKAAITTAVAPPYAMDAAPIASDWATASLGTSFRINEQWLLRGSVTATAFDPQTVSYGGEMGVNFAF